MDAAVERPGAALERLEAHRPDHVGLSAQPFAFGHRERAHREGLPTEPAEEEPEHHALHHGIVDRLADPLVERDARVGEREQRHDDVGNPRVKGGGGAGAGSDGGTATTNNVGGPGGSGYEDDITGSPVRYGGGGGGCGANTPGLGTDGGGNGGSDDGSGRAGKNGTDGRGSGGGGAYSDGNAGGNGGDAPVIIRFPAARRYEATGNVAVSTVADDVVLTFTNGPFTLKLLA